MSQVSQILVADDDPDDVLLLKEAMGEVGNVCQIRSVADGQELMEYLGGREKGGEVPRPDLILLDLNMPRKNGFEVLKELKADPVYRRIPVVIWTTSRREEDVSKTYFLGCNSYMTKPASFEELVGKMKGLLGYWFQLVDLPRAKTA